MILAWLHWLIWFSFAATRRRGSRERFPARAPLGKARAARLNTGFVISRFPSVLGPPFRRPSRTATCPIRGGPV
jgi:hypothetical protein